MAVTENDREVVTPKAKSDPSRSFREWFRSEFVRSLAKEAWESQRFMEKERSGSDEGIEPSNKKRCVVWGPANAPGPNDGKNSRM